MRENWGDKEFALAKVKEDGFNLQFVSRLLRADYEVVLAAVQNYGWALAYVSPELQDDKEIVLLAIKNEQKNGIPVPDTSILKYVSKRLQHDKEVVDAAMKSHKKAELWAYPPQNEWADKTFVLKQVQNSGNNLEKASDELKADRDVVYTAIEQQPYALAYVRNKELIIEILETKPQLCDKVYRTLRSDNDIRYAIFKAKDMIYEEKKEIALAKVRENGLALENVGEELQNDNDVVFAALKNNIDAFEFIGMNIANMLPNLLMEKLIAEQVKNT